MTSVTKYLIAAYTRFKGLISSALILLFLARIFAVLLNVPRNFGELVRPDLYFPDYAGWFQLSLLLLLFFAYFWSGRKLPVEFQYKSALIYPATFVLLAFANLKLGSKLALYRIFEAEAIYEDLSAILTMDLFFQSPFIFWSLCWYALVFYFTRKGGHERIIDLLCIWPLLQFSGMVSNFQVIFVSGIFLVTLIATKFAQRRSPLLFHYLWGLSFLGVLAFLSNYAIVYRSSLLSALVLFPLTWIVGFRFIKFCEKRQETAPGSLSHAWFYLPFFAFLFSYSINEIPMGPGVFNFWFLLASFSYAFLSILHLAIIVAVSIFFGFFKQRLEKPVFAVLLTFTLLYYIIDAFVFLKLGQRLDYHAINWVLGLSRLNLFLETAHGMLSWKHLLGLFGMPLLFLALFRIGKKHQQKFSDSSAGFVPAVFLLASLSSFIGIRLLCMPINVLGDPLQKFAATVPYFDNIFKSVPELSTLKQELAATGFDIDKTTARFVQQQQALPDKPPTNLILITLESTGTQYLSLFGSKDMTMPLLESIKDRIEIFPFYFSTFPESANAEFSIFSGLMPTNFHIFRHKPNFVGKTLIEILKAAGFDCSLFFCIYTGNTGILSFFAPRGADRLYDATSMPGMTREDGWIWGLKEHFVADKISEFLEQKKDSKDPFFIYFRTAFPHAPFDPIDNSPPVFAKNLPPELDRIARFKDCILYLDKQIFKIVETLKRTKLASNTHIIITGDHVTNLGEDGRVGHGWNLEPRLTNVPLAIIYPTAQGFKVNKNIGSHIDLMPTALNLIGVKSPLPLAVQGGDLRQPQPADKRVFISSFNHLALIEDYKYYWYRKAINNTMVVALDRVDDKIRFRQVATTAEDVKGKTETMKKVAELQSQLIMNFDHYAESIVERAVNAN